MVVTGLTIVAISGTSSASGRASLRASSIGSTPIVAAAINDPGVLRAQRLRAAAASARAEQSKTVMQGIGLRRQRRLPLSSSASSIDVPTTSEAFKDSSARIDNKQGVYLSASSVARKDFLEKTMQSILDAGGTSLVFDVKGGKVLFHSAAPLANEIGLAQGSYDLKEVVRQAREKGLYTIGRFVAIKDYGFTEKKPETRVRHPKTGAVISADWIDPSSELAIRYNAEVMCEIAASGIDEVNMDYIRFSTAQFGALRVFSGKEKADKVEQFIIAMRDAINRCGPSTKLGISTFAILGWNYDANVETLGQDVIRFAPLVDVISPMAYPATFTSPEYYVQGRNPGSRMHYLVYRTLKGYADFLGAEHAAKIRPWIQGYGVSTKNMADQIRAVYDAGFCGYQVWNANNNYDPAYKAMRSDVVKPERCGGAIVVAR